MVTIKDPDLVAIDSIVVLSQRLISVGRQLQDMGERLLRDSNAYVACHNALLDMLKDTSWMPREDVND
jgi:hypothetical protein